MSAKPIAFTWSYSAAHVFENQCQRKWYFSEQVANHRATNLLRHEAHLLSQLQSLEAWRGSLVDEVIQRYIIVPMNTTRNWAPDRVRILREARRMFQTQLDFALNKKSRTEGLIKSDYKWEFAALYNVEYGKPITQAEIDLVWQEVETALTNLLSWNEMMTLLSKSVYRIAQRRLFFSINEIKIAAVPDVVLFFDNAPPLIIDWKAKLQTDHSFWRQLACYALALVKCKPHTDFEQFIVGLNSTDVNLMEVQLLARKYRKYKLSHDDVNLIEDAIYSSGRRMLTTLQGETNDFLFPHDYNPTNNPKLCETCQFQKMCWIGKSKWEQLLQTYAE